MATSSSMHFFVDNYSAPCSYFPLDGSFNIAKPLPAGSSDMDVKQQVMFMAESNPTSTTSTSCSRRWVSDQASASKYGFGFAKFSCVGQLAPATSSTSGGSADIAAAVAQGADNFGGGSGGVAVEQEGQAINTPVRMRKREESHVAGRTQVVVEEPLTISGKNSLRTCKLCGTSKTPLWRSGPQGPKSLCNACGIRFKKSKRAAAAAAALAEDGYGGGLDSDCGLELVGHYRHQSQLQYVAASPSSSTSKKLKKVSPSPVKQQANQAGGPRDATAKHQSHRQHQPLTSIPDTQTTLTRTILPIKDENTLHRAPHFHAPSPSPTGPHPRHKNLPALTHVPPRSKPSSTSSDLLHLGNLTKKRNRPAEDIALRRCRVSPETSTATSSSPLLAKDELEQAAFLLMALSCGLVLA